MGIVNESSSESESESSCTSPSAGCDGDELGLWGGLGTFGESSSGDVGTTGMNGDDTGGSNLELEIAGVERRRADACERLGSEWVDC